MKNNAGVTRIVTYNCRKMAICCFLLLCIKVSWRHLANLKQMLRICALLALHRTLRILCLAASKRKMVYATFFLVNKFVNKHSDIKMFANIVINRNYKLFCVNVAELQDEISRQKLYKD